MNIKTLCKNFIFLGWRYTLACGILVNSSAAGAIASSYGVAKSSNFHPFYGQASNWHVTDASPKSVGTKEPKAKSQKPEDNPVDKFQSRIAEDLPTFNDQPTKNEALSSVEGLGMENLDETNSDENQLAQLTSVSQLSDVTQRDWAYTALRSLVERYGCIAGYPDKTYRGNRALSRYEFAAGLNACLNQINKLIAANTDLVRREDLATLEQLRSEFTTELATLKRRVDSLEARTSQLEAHQFSTTTKLSGLTVVGVQGRSSNRADLFPRNGIRKTKDLGTNINLINLNQLYLTTQFDKRSYLLTGLLVTNGTTAPRLTNDVILGYELYNSSNVVLSDLNYRFLITDKFAAIVGTEGVNMVYAFRGPNRVESAATGPLSVFAQRNPILNTGFGRGGFGFDWQFAKRASLQAVYSSANSGLPGANGGLFNGHNTTGVQLALTPVDPLDITVYYVNDYSPDGSLLTGTGDEQLSAVNPLTGQSAPLRTNAIGTTINWRISPRITLGGWFGYTNSYIPGESGNVETTNYMAYLNFPDLFGQGNLGGIYIGQPPKIVSSNLPVGNNIPDALNTGLGRKGGQPGTTTQVEAFYRMRVTDNISITPGIIFIFKPRHTPASDSITIGILRTTFTF